MQRFERKAVLVTGAASGIGRAATLRLFEEGAALVLADRNQAGLAGLREALNRDGRKVRVLTYDAADGEASAEMAARACSEFGQLDCVICNAGILRRTHFSDISAEEWTTMLNVNLASVVRVIQGALPTLKQSRGNVVSIASTAGINGIAYAAHYAAAKAGIIALTKSLAVEYAPSGIRFNAICPGRVKTQIATSLPPLADQNDTLLVRAPRLAGLTDGGEPSDIAAAIAYLASDDARYVSGSVLVADGAQNIG